MPSHGAASARNPQSMLQSSCLPVQGLSFRAFLACLPAPFPHHSHPAGRWSSGCGQESGCSCWGRCRACPWCVFAYSYACGRGQCNRPCSSWRRCWWASLLRPRWTTRYVAVEAADRKKNDRDDDHCVLGGDFGEASAGLLQWQDPLGQFAGSRQVLTFGSRDAWGLGHDQLFTLFSTIVLVHQNE